MEFFSENYCERQEGHETDDRLLVSGPGPPGKTSSRTEGPPISTREHLVCRPRGRVTTTGRPEPTVRSLYQVFTLKNFFFLFLC